MLRRIARNGAVGVLAAHRDRLVANSVTDLGKSSDLTMATAGGNVTSTISYWKDIEHLQAFANGPSHRLGLDWWASESKKYPHIGIMHETFAVPKAAWENIYHNFQPVGMCESTQVQKFHMLWANIQAAQLQYPVRESKDAPPKFISTTMRAKGGKWRTMASRMGGKEDEGADD